MERWKAVLVFFCLLVSCSSATLADYFSYLPPGRLIAGSGAGKVDQNIHAPGIRFPVESGPAYANSQRWRPGGEYGSGTSSDPLNFKYPWQDNFCETRGNSWSTPECPDQNGGHHQGQDIRPPTNQKNIYWAVAVTGGQISYRANDYVIELKENDQSSYRYLHLDPTKDTPGGSIDGLLPSGTVVNSGMRIGKISNWFGGGATTIHLHFDILKFMPTWGRVTWASPYMSLVRSYEKLIGYKGFTINSSVKVTGLGTGFLPVYGSTGCGSVIGYRGEASVAVVLDGPVICGGEIRWKVRFQDCLEGWVSSQWLKATSCSAALVNPRDGASVSFPAQFTGGWTGDCRNPQLAFSNGQQGTSFPASSFYDQTITADYWNQTIVPKIGNGPTYYWSIGENFCGGFFPRANWQSFRASSSCSAPMAFMARRGLLPRAMALQCGGNSPTATATFTKMNTTTPTRTQTLPPGVPSQTATRSSTITKTPTPTPSKTPTYTRTIAGTPTPTPGPLVFRDDFNRPDATVAGNGWFNVHPSIFVRGNRLVGGGIVTRELPFQFPIRLKVCFFAGGCGTEGGITNHFDHQISVFTDAYGSGGIGLSFFRADQNVSTSQINLMQGGVLIDRIYALAEFVDFVDLDATIFADGSVRGAYRTQGIEQSFSFPSRSLDIRGSSLALRSYSVCPENHLAFDDLVIEANGVSVVSTPTGTPTRISTATAIATASATSTATTTPHPSSTPTKTLTPGGSCFQVHQGSGCDDLECQQKVCYHQTLGNPACCGGGTSPRGWTQTCVASAQYFCRPTATPSFIPTSTPTPTSMPTSTRSGSDCCSAHNYPGCSIALCMQAVCAIDSFCCGSFNGFWDQSCTNIALSASKMQCGC